MSKIYLVQRTQGERYECSFSKIITWYPEEEKAKEHCNKAANRCKEIGNDIDEGQNEFDPTLSLDEQE